MFHHSDFVQIKNEAFKWSCFKIKTIKISFVKTARTTSLAVKNWAPNKFDAEYIVNATNIFLP